MSDSLKRPVLPGLAVEPYRGVIACSEHGPVLDTPEGCPFCHRQKQKRRPEGRRFEADDGNPITD